MSNRMIELHDSTIAEIIFNGDVLIVRFSPVYIHKWEGGPGIPPHTGWIQNAELAIDKASIQGATNFLPADIMDGELTAGSVQYPNSIPIPFDTQGEIRLHLEFTTGESITINGAAARLKLLGEPKFVEDVS